MKVTGAAQNLREWERLVASMPGVVREAIPLRLWDRTKLYALDLPLREIPIDDLRWMLDIPLWAVDGIAFRVAPNQVIANPVRYPEQYRRVQGADLSFPIHVVWHNDRWTILDGVHRLLKSSRDGHTHIAAMVLSKDDFQRILVSDNEADEESMPSLADAAHEEDIATSIAAVDIPL